jgi:hypothetical protein
VLTVERGQRVLVALADPPQQLSVAAGLVVTGGEGSCAEIQAWIVHLASSEDSSEIK